ALSRGRRQRMLDEKREQFAELLRPAVRVFGGEGDGCYETSDCDHVGARTLAGELSGSLRPALDTAMRIHDIGCFGGQLFFTSEVFRRTATSPFARKSESSLSCWSAYVFVPTGDAWSQQQKIPSPVSHPSGCPSRLLGSISYRITGGIR